MEGILLLDPAWPAPTRCNYKSMTLKQIEDMPIQHIFKKGIIYLWVIESLIDKGCELMKKWGYEFKA
jgi:N6-adenosine-specific RNA methylase IME4